MHQIVLKGSSKSRITPKTEFIMLYFFKNAEIIYKSTLTIYAGDKEI